MEDFISVKGACVHNLKNVDVKIPRNKLVVFTGLSGSGKSSLAFDTIYAEGQRRYVESLSAYARQFLGVMDKPDVDRIDGLSPAISIDQKTASHNPRSTVGTVTEIYDYLRLLYARAGRAHCPTCGKEISKQTPQQVAEKVMELPRGSVIMLLAPLVRDQKGEHRSVFEEKQKAGYARLRIDGNFYTIDEALALRLDKQKKHSIELVVDRLLVENSQEDETRLTDSLEITLRLGGGFAIVHEVAGEKDILYSEQFSCPSCDINLPPIEPRSFSFNSPHGACVRCSGLGTKMEIDPELVFPNKKLTLAQGAIRPWSRTSANQTWYYRIIKAVADAHDFSLDVPVGALTAEDMKKVLYGTGDKKYHVADPLASGKVKEFETTYEGVIPNLERRYKETDSDYMRSEIERYMRLSPCPECKGKRLRPEVLAVTVGGYAIDVVVRLTIDKALAFFGTLQKIFDGKKVVVKKLGKDESGGLSIVNEALPTETEALIGRQILKEIVARLRFLTDVGLNYLTLDRRATTLSGGEAQRIRLATQIGSSLVGVLYILDEPSIGLHQRDNAKLIATLKNLRDLGNTVIVVEHDEETITNADYVLDIGPGAGERGGHVIAEGTSADIAKKKDSLTGQYLSGRKKIVPPRAVRRGNGKELIVKGAQEHNLRVIDVAFPLGKFVCVTGVSGSGKSTLVTEILAKALASHFYRAKDVPGRHKGIEGLRHIDKVVDIDQSPIGRTPRSNPATYTGVFTYIRELFASLPEAKARGYKAGRFSFNVKGGRCEGCQGDGVVKIEMQFLPDVYVECQECHGHRYNAQALEITYKGKTVSDALNMTVDTALEFFANVPSIKNKLATLSEVGLGYVHLGQNATTLSGGEAQRVKLSSELSRRATGKTLYILDEPTTGLHFDDVARLLHVLGKLVDKGNTVLVIEHNLDVIKSADWLIDLGPEGGDAGGYIVAEGTPRDVAKVKESFTGRFLKRVL